MTVAAYCRCGAALVGGKPGRDNAAVGREGRCFGHADEKPQREDGGDRGRAGQKADRALREREDRPDENARAIDAPRTELVEQPAAGQLGNHIRPAEGRENVAELHCAHAEVLLHRGAGNRDRGTVGIVDGRHDEEHREDQKAYARGAQRALGALGADSGSLDFHVSPPFIGGASLVAGADRSSAGLEPGRFADRYQAPPGAGTPSTRRRTPQGLASRSASGNSASGKS